LEISVPYTSRSGRAFLVRLNYNERIRDSEGSQAFVNSLQVLDAESKSPVDVPVNTQSFSTFENFTSFGSYKAINYLGVREAAIEGLRLKILTRVEDALERLA
jgi:hypothetical protein